MLALPAPHRATTLPRRARPALTSQTMTVLWPIWAAACSGVMPSWARAWGSAPQSCTRYWMISRWPSWQARYSGVAPVLVWALSVLQAGHSAHHPLPLLPAAHRDGWAQGTRGLQGHGGHMGAQGTRWWGASKAAPRPGSVGSVGSVGWEPSTPRLPTGSQHSGGH